MTDRNILCLTAQQLGGANKSQNTRPLALFPAAENKELLEEFIPIVETEIEKVKKEGVVVTLKDKEQILACCEKARLKMADGKMVTNILNCGGAFCTMCLKSQEEAHMKENIEKGFTIERSVQSMKDLAEYLTDHLTGEVI